MAELMSDGGCKRKCWIAAAVLGVFVALFSLGRHEGIFAALVLGLLAVGLLGCLFTWLACAPVPKLSPRVPAPMPKPEPVAPVTPAPVAEEPAAPAPVAPAAEADPVIKPSAPLSGEAELASRKGSWKYEADAPAGGPAKPEALSTAREGGADNLKEIKGVGPKLEELLHELGIFHFDQIAGWSAAEVAWMDENLKGFRGRVSRDDWIGQAKILATGGETEFSQRVESGEVY